MIIRKIKRSIGSIKLYAVFIKENSTLQSRSWQSDTNNDRVTNFKKDSEFL